MASEKTRLAPKRGQSLGITLRLPLDLYAKAALQSGGASFHHYLTTLICRDLGIDPDTQELTWHRRSEWKISPTKNKPHKEISFLCPKPIHAALAAKLAALPYPVLLSQYLRRLVEKDVE